MGAFDTIEPLKKPRPIFNRRRGPVTAFFARILPSLSLAGLARVLAIAVLLTVAWSLGAAVGGGDINPMVSAYADLQTLTDLP